MLLDRRPSKKVCKAVSAVSSPGGIATDGFNLIWTNKAVGTEFGSGQIAGCSDLGCDHLRWRFEGRYTATDDGPIDGSEYDCEKAKQNAPPGLDVQCPDQDNIYENWKCYDCRTADCNGHLAGKVNGAGQAGPWRGHGGEGGASGV